MSVDLMDLARRLQAAERRLEQIPHRWERPPSPIPYLAVVSGNTISGFNGIRYSTSVITSVPATSPSPSTIYTNGLGLAVMGSTAVWAAFAAVRESGTGATRYPGRAVSLFAGAFFFAYTDPILVDGPGSVPVPVYLLRDC